MADVFRQSLGENETSFANVLASFTRGAKNPRDAWDDSLLAEDVASISYERALQSRPPAPGSGRSVSSTRLPESPEAASGKAQRRIASITIRLTADEQNQLHDRAAEAGLSISAYLRSCVFEAESLRAQVKEALSEMRAAKGDASAEPNEEAPAMRRRVGWFSRWTHRRERSA